MSKGLYLVSVRMNLQTTVAVEASSLQEAKRRAEEIVEKRIPLKIHDHVTGKIKAGAARSAIRPPRRR